ncbi:hypothetical protein [Nocardia pseudobrasiliensis]|uniref:Class 3 adenylate cyclase n=1 Tax=Nocardia pseudobrasiliensis TaxID=45979 RepID=A0A370IEN0_9NOCA|nr:hypothetical protein [Nocardia pseudobrasiliensis]RDI69030.1 hypothetical protein DFR76_101568 [Nocardia pseudobrasiliensis]
MPEPTHQSFLVVDVENSESLTNVQSDAMRVTLNGIIDGALPHPAALVAREDRGDGAMLIFGIPVLDVLDQVVGAMLTGVREHNSAAGPMNWLRIRIAVHEGYVGRDDNGWSSDALTLTFRMNAAEAAKYALEHAPRANSVVVVSDVVFRGVVRHGYRDTVTPDEYDSATMHLKSDTHQIWVRVPGYPRPSLPKLDSAPTESERGAIQGSGTTGSGPDAATIHATNFIGGNAKIGTQVGRDNHYRRS